MTIMPLVGARCPLLVGISKPLLQFSSMAAEAHGSRNSSEIQSEDVRRSLANYPVPLSPPPPLISKDVELNRALTASSKSALFSLSREDVLFEDEWLIAVNKPQGIYCESVLSAVRNLLDADRGDQTNPELHLSNRLDRDTSGVTIVTKSHKVAAKLVKAFTDHNVKKTYIAFCVGALPKWTNMVIKSGHGRSRHGAWRVYALSDAGRALPGGSCIRDMETSFEVVSVNGRERTRPSPASGESVERIVVEGSAEVAGEVENGEVVVRAHPRSGRTHQIRLHCQYLGIPIRGDVKYDGVYKWNGKIYDGHELHAESLSFEHPVTGRPVSICAPLPLWACADILNCERENLRCSTLPCLLCLNTKM
ncbi:RNA pseudouridine synthase 1 [Andrographis paniculata]|uniref:RNA pseudouridine synthase 1 n=1 Tax=Andrographis paniculata TaxID=175694 RepID=UPI0021E90AE9|nr:RNA pseudouridine synthase 1 [Andrographis paniculata]